MLWPVNVLKVPGVTDRALWMFCFFFFQLIALASTSLFLSRTGFSSASARARGHCPYIIYRPFPLIDAFGLNGSKSIHFLLFDSVCSIPHCASSPSLSLLLSLYLISDFALFVCIF